MVNNRLLARASVLWFILVALTVLSIEFPATIAGGRGHSIQLGGIVVLTFVKVFIIGWKFMELDHAPALFRSFFLLWVAGIGGSILFFALN